MTRLFVVDAGAEAAGAAAEADREGRALARVELREHFALEPVDRPVAGLEHGQAGRRQLGPDDAAVVARRRPADETAVDEPGQDLVHRLRRHQRPARQLRVRETRAGADDGERRVLPDGQVLRTENLVEPAAESAVEPSDQVADAWLGAGHGRQRYNE